MDEALTESLERANLHESRNVTRQIKAGASIEFESESKATAPALRETYESRSSHLAQFTSHHARRLKRATDEFCENLAACSEDQAIAYARVDDALIGSYVIWYIVDDLMPIGCLYVIGKTEVPQDSWAQLWNDP